jgi:hypothetical protein
MSVPSAALVHQPAAAASAAHREFFDARGDSRQVWAKEAMTGKVVHLPEGEADAFRAACDAGEFVCPIPGCQSPAFRARGAEVRRHHFAHRHATVGHRPHEIWRVEALAALRDWLTARWTGVQIEEFPDSLVLTSARLGRKVHLEVAARRVAADTWHARRRAAEGGGRAYQLILAPRPSVVTPLDDLGGGAYSVNLTGLVSAMVSQSRVAVVLNPAHRLVGTLTWTSLARAAELPVGTSNGMLFVEKLDDAELCETGMLPSAAAKVRAVTVRPRPRRPAPRRPASAPPPGPSSYRRPRPPEHLPAVAEDAVADESMDDMTRYAIFKQKMRRYREIARPI